MREQIIKVLRQSVGMRKRDIAWRCQCGVTNSEFIKTMCDLDNEGIITRTTFRDIGNMEFYDIWKLADGV